MHIVCKKVNLAYLIFEFNIKENKMEFKEIYVLIKKVDGLDFLLRSYDDLEIASTECDRLNNLYIDNKNYYCRVEPINLHITNND